jgi:hypothetical protein
MPNKTLAKTTIALILSLTVSLQVVGLTMANPVPWPSTPNQEKPTLTILSPKNNTEYEGSDVYLNFAVSTPDSWKIVHMIPISLGRVASVNAYLDGNSVNYGYKSSREYFFRLNLNQSTIRQHVLNVTVLSFTYYRGPAYNNSHIVSDITSSSGPVYEYPLVVSDIVYFTVAGEPFPSTSALPLETESFSTASVAAVSVAVAVVVVAGASLLFYRKHRKMQFH